LRLVVQKAGKREGENPNLKNKVGLFRLKRVGEGRRKKRGKWGLSHNGNPLAKKKKKKNEKKGESYREKRQDQPLWGGGGKKKGRKKKKGLQTGKTDFSSSPVWYKKPKEGKKDYKTYGKKKIRNPLSLGTGRKKRRGKVEKTASTKNPRRGGGAC